MIKILKNFLMVLHIEIIYDLFPLYVALVYKKQHTIRSKIYSYWLLNDKERFINFKYFNLNKDFFNFYYIEGLYTVIKYKDKFYYLGYSKDLNKYNTENKFKRFINKIEYLLFYYFGYIYLDDINNINGINPKVFNSKYYLTSMTEKEIKMLEGIKVQTSVFDFSYWNDKYIPTIEQCKFFIEKSYTYNYLRDKCYNNTYKKFLFLSYKQDYETNNYLLAFNNRILLKRIY